MLKNLHRRLNAVRNDEGNAGIAVIAAGVVVVLVIALIWFLVWEGESFGSTDGGHVAIVRNGGPFDNTKIRQVLPASSGRTNIGMYSSLHQYPTSQRFFTIDSNGGGDSDDVVNVPTADGVDVGIEGTAYFTLNVSGEARYSILKSFDNKYGTRTFKCTGSNNSKHVYDGDDGFSCFLDQVVSPVINNDLRQSIGDLKCADLVASCSLVQNSTATAAVDPTKVGQGNINLSKIETEISTSLQSDMNDTLGGHYLTVERFNLAKVTLPTTVQTAINNAQGAFAGVTKAQAALRTAQINAATNAARQKGYANCPACQQIDILGALPKGITVYAPGNSSLNLAVPTK